MSTHISLLIAYFIATLAKVEMTTTTYPTYEINYDNNNISSSLQSGSDQQDNDTFSIIIKIFIAIVCVIVILLSLLGNALVVSVILRFKRLKNATNYILLSLAIADLTVSILVMLPAMIQDVLQKWVFSHLFCKFYNAFDITCCTASILHLLLVAIDRYIAIFKPLTYRDVVRKWHIFTTVLFVWSLSFLMSFLPIFMGWNQLARTTDTSKPFSNLTLTNTTSEAVYFNSTDLNQEPEVCSLEANIPYAIISSSLSFYIPLVIMTIVYLQIYIVARRQANAIAQLDIRSRFNTQESHTSNNLNNGSATNIANGGDILNDQQIKKINKILTENGESRGSDDKTDKKSKFLKMIKQLKSIERKKTKDTKAIKTLGIIMGWFKLNFDLYQIFYLVLLEFKVFSFYAGFHFLSCTYGYH